MGLQGKVYLVGAGPGDRKLVTLRGMELIRAADVILYDRLVNPDLLQWAKPNAELIFCGKSPQKHTMKQEEINDMLVGKAKKGKRVVRLKGGDPSIFGRVGEEAWHCRKHQVEFEIVPGIISGIAASSYAGIPLTHRNLNASVAFVTGHKKTESMEEVEWSHLAKAVETIVFYMGVGNAALIQEKLLENGKQPDTPVAFVRWGTLSCQETFVTDLEHMADAVRKGRIKPPAIIVVGENVALRSELAWFERKPALKQRVLLPHIGRRDPAEADSLSFALEEAGAELSPFPLSVSLRDEKALVSYFRSLESYADIVFSSSLDVEFFLEALQRFSIDIRRVEADLYAMDDRAGSALRKAGLMAETVSERRGLGRGTLVLSSEFHPALPEAGEAAVLRLYDFNVRREAKRRLTDSLLNGAFSWVLFSSPDVLLAFRHVAGEGMADLLRGAVVCESKAVEETAVHLGISEEILRQANERLFSLLGTRREAPDEKMLACDDAG